MVRKPTIELIHYLNKTNFDAPVLRYVLCKLPKLMVIYYKYINILKSYTNLTF